MFNLPNFRTIFKKGRKEGGRPKKAGDEKLKEGFSSVGGRHKISEENKKNNAIKIEFSGYDDKINANIRKPVFSEKSFLLKENNKYIFAVSENATKKEVAKSIAQLYKVKVEDVNISKSFGKIRRRGRQIGWKVGNKKAIVTLKKGEKIDLGL